MPIRVMLAAMEDGEDYQMFCRDYCCFLLPSCSLILFLSVTTPCTCTAYHNHTTPPIQPSSNILYAVTSTVHHSCSRPASGTIKAKRKQQASKQASTDHRSGGVE